MMARLRAIVLVQLTAWTLAGGAHAGTITTFAGGGAVQGDGGPATSARLLTPQGVAVDAAGNLYIADDTAFVVRRVDATTGIITTAAGNGLPGNQGDGGPATGARLRSPMGIAVDLSGDPYIADQLNHRIRKVDMATGFITTIAGTGLFGESGDNGPAINAGLAFPEGVAVDGIGDVFIADTQNLRVRRVTRTSGIITAIAGRVFTGESAGDGALALDATFGGLRRIAVDVLGNYYVVDFNGTTGVVRRVNAGQAAARALASQGSRPMRTSARCATSPRTTAGTSTSPGGSACGRSTRPATSASSPEPAFPA